MKKTYTIIALQTENEIHNTHEAAINYEKNILTKDFLEILPEDISLIKSELAFAFIAGAKYQEKIDSKQFWDLAKVAENRKEMLEKSITQADAILTLSKRMEKTIDKMYSEKEVVDLIKTAFKDARNSDISIKEWFNQFKK